MKDGGGKMLKSWGGEGHGGVGLDMVGEEVGRAEGAGEGRGGGWSG